MYLWKKLNRMFEMQTGFGKKKPIFWLLFTFPVIPWGSENMQIPQGPGMCTSGNTVVDMSGFEGV